MSASLLSSEDLKALAKGIESFNQKDFWQCHEDLEDWWLEHQFEPRVNVVWAIIQVATAIFHAQRNNINGARSQLKKAKKKLEKVKANSIDTESIDEILSWKEFVSLIESTSDEASIDEIKKLSEFEFRNYKVNSQERSY